MSECRGQLRLARLVRAHHPSSVIVFGGPHATLLGRDILKAFPDIDVIAVNEGEHIIVRLVEALLSKDAARIRSVPNLLIREEDGNPQNYASEPQQRSR